MTEKFSTLVTALEARGEELTLGYVQQALIHEEQKLSSTSSLSEGGGEQRALLGKQVRCYGCGEVWHICRYCPQRNFSTHKASTAEENNGGERLGAFTASMGFPGGNRWIVDSGATSHMMRDRAVLTDYKEFKVTQKVSLGDGRFVDAVGAGNVRLTMSLKVSQPLRVASCMGSYMCPSLPVTYSQ